MESPGICAWAASLDAIVFAELRDIRLVDAPTVAYTNDMGIPWKDRWEYVDECNTMISPALVLDLDIKHTLRGELTGEVSARVGNRHLGQLSPFPYRKEDGSIGWRNAVREELGGEQLEVGQMIGLGLHYLPEHDVWSVMGEPMFGVDGRGGIRFQRRVGFDPGPEAATGLEVSELASVAGACSSSPESDERRESYRRSWGPDGRRPTHYLAAKCVNVDADPTDTCASDTDCDKGFICIHRECVTS
jgi:hypothetical protein